MQKSLKKIMPYTPTALAVVLVVAVAYSLARFALFVIYGDQTQNLETVETAQAVLKADTRKIDTAQIAQWHLFGEVGAKADRPVPTTTNAPDTKLHLDLVGVYLAPDARESSAIIVEKGEADRYKVGDELPGGVSLHEVYADRVIIERSGRLETLRFSEKALVNDTSSRTSRPVITSRPQRSGSVLRDIRQGSISNTKEVLQRLNQNPAEQLTSFINEAGLEPTDSGGYRVSPSAPRDVLSAVGLRQGDVINQINGHNLSVVQSDAALLEEILSSGEAKIEVQRGKRKFTVSYPLP